MIIYIEVLFIIFIAIILKKDKFVKYGIPIILLSLALIVGTRNNLGLDDNNYIEIFNNIKEGYLNKTRNAEAAYIFISKIIVKLGFNYKMLFLVYSITTALCIYLGLKKLNFKKEQFIIYIIAYVAICFFPYLTAMRQFLATGICFLGMAFMKENKKIKAIALIIIAGFFHNSAWICLLLILLFNEKISISNRTKILLPLICLISCQTKLLYLIANFLNNILNLGYKSYLETFNSTVFINSGMFVILIFLLYNIQYLFSYKKDENDDFFQKGEMLYFSTFFIAINAGFLARFSYYFMIFEPYVLVGIIDRIKDKKQKTIASLLIGICLLSLIVYIVENTELAGSLDFNNFSLKILN